MHYLTRHIATLRLARPLARQFPRYIRPASQISAMASSSQKTTSTSSSTESQSPATADAQSKPSTPLALPGIGEGSTTLDVSNGGTVVKLDHLGPMVVNVDGTLSRITNWDDMSEFEKKNTLRIIGKRNVRRMEDLREKEQQDGENKE